MDQTADSQTERTSASEIHPRPDVRQSIVYTLLAASFVSLLLRNRDGKVDWMDQFHFWAAAGLGVLVLFSWYLVVRKWLRWKKQASDIKAAQGLSASLDRPRATSHALLSLLTVLLSVFAFLEHAVTPLGQETKADNVMFYTGAIIAVGGAAILSRSVRDLLRQRRVSKQI